MTEQPNVFEERYQQGGWNGMGSGPGSAPTANIDYLRFLQQLLHHTPNISTVLDIGCGDWQLMRCANLHGIHYLGVDVAPSVITKNRERYTTPFIQFAVMDVTSTTPPVTDLIIIKDVLQHLPYEQVFTLLKQRLANGHSWLLITNDHTEENGRDIEVGDYRPINVLREPFNMPGVVVLAYGDKRTVLIGPRSSS